MVAALILVISSAMLAQFLVFFWRANMLAVAAQPLTGNLNAAQADAFGTLKSDDFRSLATLSKICPGVTSSSVKLWPVRAYYQAVRALSRISAAMPQANAWALQEMACCTRYLEVSIERCLESNQAYVAALRSY
jgi:hypothetical protein